MTSNNDFSLVTFRPTIYKFFRMAKWNKPDIKKVLDCGAGGVAPPLALFCRHGYETFGIDNSEVALDQAKDFAQKYNLQMNLSIGDMRELSFEDEYFDLVYSYNSSIHLTKKDTEKAVNEMLRVLNKGGILCLNFLWHNNVHPSLGEEKNSGEFWSMEHGQETVHSHFTEDEIEKLLQGTKLLFKEKVQMKFLLQEDYVWESSFEFIVQKEK